MNINFEVILICSQNNSLPLYRCLTNHILMSKLQDNEIFDILTGKISSAINKALLRAFNHEGIHITTEQWLVLSCLWNEDKITQQDICDLTHKDKPSMTRLIDNLEKRNLVVRVSHPTDRRINLIHLTSDGLALKGKTTKAVDRVVNQALEGISDEDLSLAREFLLKVMKNLENS